MPDAGTRHIKTVKIAMEDVVVTGMGVVSSLGADLDSFWESLINGKQGYTSNSSPMLQDQPFPLTGKIPSFLSEAYSRNEEDISLDRAAQLAVAAAGMAIDDAKLKIKTDNAYIPVVMGTTCGANLTIEEKGFDEAWFSEVSREIDLEILAQYDHCSIANAISNNFSLQGPSYIVGTACAAGNHAVGEAADLIKLGRAEVVLCGGAESFSLLPVYGFHAINALADDACRPFDKERQGYVIGEGAGVMVLESLTHAKARGAHIYARLVNWALNCDATSFALPIADGARCRELILDCLDSSGLKPEDIDYINLHGTGSKTNDLMEVNGIKQAFPHCYRTISASSIKAMLGHTFGAAGILDNIATVLSLQKGVIPPIINLQTPDEGFDLNFVTKPHHAQRIDTALSLSFAFGGCNVATIFSRP